MKKVYSNKFSWNYNDLKLLIIQLLQEKDVTADKQAKDVFTTLCLFWNIEVDTFKCDNLIKEFQQRAERENEEDFYNFMVQDII